LFILKNIKPKLGIFNKPFYFVSQTLRMKEEQERLLKYIGEIYSQRRLERSEGKDITSSTPEHNDIVKAGKNIRLIREKKR